MNKKEHILAIIKEVPKGIKDEIEYFCGVIQESYDEIPEESDMLIDAFDRVVDQAIHFNDDKFFGRSDLAWIKEAVIQIGWAIPYDKNAVRTHGNTWFMFKKNKYEFVMNINQLIGL